MKLAFARLQQICIRFSGYYCASDGLSAETGVCSAGYYCTGNATQPNPTDGVTGDICPAGYYCTAGSQSPAPCPDGTYSNSTGNQAMSDCNNCTAGWFFDSLPHNATF